MAFAAESVMGVGQWVAKGLAEPMFSFIIQPGKYKYPNRKKLASGKVKMGKRKFIPSPWWPEGIRISFPTWFVFMVGIPVVIHFLGGFEKVMSGLGIEMTEEEVNAWEILGAFVPITQVGKLFEGFSF